MLSMFGPKSFLALFVASSPLMVKHILGLAAKPHYQFALLLIPFIAILTWWKIQLFTRDERKRLLELYEDEDLALNARIRTRSSWIENGIGLLCLSTLAVGLLYVSPVIGFCAASFAMVGYCFSRLGYELGKVAFPSLALLFLCIPIPFGIDHAIIQRLQLFTAQISSTFLDWFQVVHLREGIVFEISRGKLFVDEACSGINSLTVIFVGCVCLAVWLQIDPFRVAVAAVYASIIATAANIVRVVMIVYFLEKRGVDLLAEPMHSLLGLVIFLLAGICCFSFIRLLGRFPQFDEYWRRLGRRRLKNHEERDALEVARPTLESRPRSRFQLPTIAVFGVVAFVLQVFCLMQSTIAESEPRIESLDQNKEGLKLSSLNFDEGLGEWKKRDFSRVQRERGNDEGETSLIWQLEKQNKSLALSIDFPFAGWHELTRCYTGQGWVIQSRIEHGVNTEQEYPIVEIDMVNSLGDRGCLLFALINSNRESLDFPRSPTLWERSVGRLRNPSLFDYLANGQQNPREAVAVYQIQFLLFPKKELSEAERIELRGDFQKAVRGLVEGLSHEQ